MTLKVLNGGQCQGGEERRVPSIFPVYREINARVEFCELNADNLPRVVLSESDTAFEQIERGLLIIVSY